MAQTDGRAARRQAPIVITCAAAVAALTVCGVAAASGDAATGPATTVRMIDTESKAVGITQLVPLGMQTQVTVTVRDQSPGYHGLHVHSVGLCEPDGDPTLPNDFLSAGGHYTTANGHQHGQHAGDLPALYVGADGTGTVTFVTDRFRVEDLRDANGSAIMIHAGRDNYANIPNRYATGGPDGDTRRTGDAGARVVCGAVTG